MHRNEVNEQSPLRILDRSIHGGLGAGNLGVVMASAGAGKTTCLVQIGLDNLMRERNVLHVALGQSLDHVLSWYEALFDDLADRTGLEDRAAERARAAAHRIIKAFADLEIAPVKIEETVALFEKSLQFRPQAILVDGFSWEGSLVRTAAALGAFKSCAGRIGAELWMTATSDRHETGPHSTRLAAPCDAYAELIDVALYLEPRGSHLSVRLLKDRGEAAPPDTHLLLHPDTGRLAGEGEPGRVAALPSSAFGLLSGGAGGAEEEFGACAERWGIAEINFTFEGRGLARARGVVELSAAELRQGDVTSSYLRSHMHRRYPDTPLFRKVLQSIWHQVSTAGEVFTVGEVLEDGTIKGGTGWAAELAKHWAKPVHCFDQARGAWFAWKEGGWRPVEAPVISRTRFTGTGTRFLTDSGRSAIRALFERSFGPPPA